MTASSAFCTMVLVELQSAHFNILMISIVLFVVLWILQFVGHHIEGKKPSFFKDVQFLLIGPAWVFHFFFPLTPHDNA
nr:Mpo1-like protein [Enterovibrio coralii]